VTGIEIAPLYDEATIRERVIALGAELGQAVAASDPLVISILGGSVIFLADLVRAIHQPLRFEFIQVHYSAGGSEPEVLEIQYPIPVDVGDQNILVLKDVVASGVIESYLASQFRQHGARDVRFAALIDMPTERKTSFEPDHRIFVAERRGTFVGYGLKQDSRYGNLPYIGVLPEPS
jgi:hypoxanthine phosphoribosyltransferase